MNTIEITKIPTLDYATSEAINTLGINVTFSGEGIRRIMVTSCREHEGKSFTSFQLAKKLSEMNYSVLLVDADLRRSVLNERMGVHFPRGSMGLTHLLTKDITLNDVVYQTNLRKLYFLPIGHSVINSIVLLNSPRFSAIMDQFKETFDYVIVDTPPIGAIVDAAAVARCCDGALLVFTPNLIDQRELLAAKEQIDKTGCPLLGGVMNKMEMKKSSSRYYYRSKYAAYRNKYYYRTRDSESTETDKKDNT